MTERTANAAPDQAGVEAFFTDKGRDVYAILPRWAGRSLHVKEVTGVKPVTPLGAAAPLKFKAEKGGVAVELPDLPEELLPQPAWVLKMSQ